MNPESATSEARHTVCSSQPLKVIQDLSADETRAQVLQACAAEVDAPLQVSDADSLSWDAETQVAVVGYGAAGASAALQAAEAGARVTVLDRLNGGGASALSGGVVYAGGGTDYQQQVGDQDTVENMFNYLRQETGGVISEATLQRFCEQSVDNLNWLQSHGVPFDSTPYDDKTSYPPDGYFLYYSGNESSAPYSDVAQPSRRGHRVKGEQMTGRVLFDHLHRSARQHPRISLKPHCEVRRLIVDAKQRVVGLEYRQAPDGAALRWLMTRLARLANRFTLLSPALGKHIRRLVNTSRARGHLYRLRVTQGVVLSAGGFIFNRPLIKQLAPAYVNTRPLGEECRGAGIGLGVTVGGDIAHMGNVSAWRFFSPPTEMIKGVLVDDQGQRICNEDLYGATTAERVLDSGTQKAYLLLDQIMMDAALTEARPSNYSWQQWLPARLFLQASSIKGQSLAQLAQRCGLPATQVQETVSAYNAGVESGSDAFGKAAKYCQTLRQGPYYAIDISLSNTRVPCMAITLGGLRVDENSGEVLNTAGKPIRGLYAAGRNAVGICSHSYISGLSLADCVFSGRRAGAHAASQFQDLGSNKF